MPRTKDFANKEKRITQIREYIIRRLDAGDLLANIRERDAAAHLGVSPRYVSKILGEPWKVYLSSDRFSEAHDEAKPTKGNVPAPLRRRQILNVALQLAEIEGLNNFDRKRIEAAIQVSNCTVHTALKPLVPNGAVLRRNVQNVIAALAIERGSQKVIGEAVAMRLPAVADLSEDEKRRAVLSLLNS